MVVFRTYVKVCVCLPWQWQLGEMMTIFRWVTEIKQQHSNAASTRWHFVTQEIAEI